MAKLTRSEFLREGATLAAALGLGHLPAAAEEQRSRPAAGPPKGPGISPDLVVVNARVYTVDDAQPRAEAFAVKDGRFIAVGSTDEVRHLATRNTRVIDAEGMTITPGFIDAHSHPASGGERELVSVNLDVRSMAEIKQRLRDRAARTPPGQWIVAFKYDDTKVREGRQITRTDLDEAVPDHPVFVSHRGGHVYWYNSKAFELAGVTAQTPSPPGGHIYVDGGELTGKVAERANDLFRRLIPSGSTREQRQAGVKLISELMTATGLTSVHDTGASTEAFTAYQDAYNAGEMRFRVYALPRGESYEHLKASGVRTGMGDEWLRVGAVKFGADGSASGRTMRMSTPYVDRPDDYGILTMTQEEIHEAVDEAHSKGWQIGIHANGDVTIEYVLNAYERAQKQWPRPDPRHRMEHATLVNPEILRRMKAAGVIPTPFWTYVYYHGDKWAEYGDEKMSWMFPHRSYLDSGIPAAGASDYVPGPYEPMMALQSMVTRKDWRGKVWGPNQRITVDEALRVMTMNGARASFEEKIKGSITAGKLADFVVLGQDPHEVDPDQIINIPIVRTVVGGKTMHQA
jgi:predicted amidohydrolase YtcJ